MFKVINISGSTLGLIKIVEGKVAQDNIEPDDYRVVSEPTPQMLRLADPSMKLIKIIINEEVS